MARMRSEDDELSLPLGGGSALQLDDDSDFDPDLADLNDPDVQELGEPPLISGRSESADLFGVSADSVGRATSPKLYESASQFPTALQFRVFKMENGVPAGLGAIDIESSEEDFVQQFYGAMPRRGQGKVQFRLRPIDARGKELGKEIFVNISEHHATLARIREEKAWDKEGPRGGRGDVHVHGGESGSPVAYEEMGRMYEHAVETAERRTEMLQASLEEERERQRQIAQEKMEERVRLAQGTSETVQKLTEKMMESDRARSEEVMASQKEHSGAMLTTMTTVFAQQQEAQRQQAEMQRQADERKMIQDREFYDRQRQELEARRRDEREEFVRRQEAERHRLEAERQREADQRKAEIERMKIEAQEREAARKLELERARTELEERRREESREYERKREDERRRAEETRLAWEKREAARREEEARRREDERRDWERREAQRREEIAKEAERRREEMQLQMKQMDVSAQRDREHAERMSEMARLEREAAREAALSREKMEREAREAADRERDRQFQLQQKEMELSKERDREHQERMMQLSRLQGGGGIQGLMENLGLDTTDVLQKIFGGGEGGSSESITDMLVKGVGALPDLAKTFTSMQAAQQPNAPGRRPVRDRPQLPQQMQDLTAEQLQNIRPAVSPVPVGLENLPDQPLRPQRRRPLPTPVAEEEEENVVLTPLQVGDQVDTVKRAKSNGINLLRQRKARKGIKKIAQKLLSVPEEEWVNYTALEIAQNEDIAWYIKAVSVYAALAEAGVSEEMAEKLVSAMRASPLLPDGIPYDEQGYKAMKILEEQQAEAEAAKTAAATEKAPVKEGKPEISDETPDAGESDDVPTAE